MLPFTPTFTSSTISSVVRAIDFAAAEARIDEGIAEADGGQMARPVRGDVAEEQMGDNSLREVVGLDLVGDGQFLQPGHQAPMTANHASDQEPHDGRKWFRPR